MSELTSLKPFTAAVNSFSELSIPIEIREIIPHTPGFRYSSIYLEIGMQRVSTQRGVSGFKEQYLIHECTSRALTRVLCSALTDPSIFDTSTLESAVAEPNAEHTEVLQQALSQALNEQLKKSNPLTFGGEFEETVEGRYDATFHLTATGIPVDVTVKWYLPTNWPSNWKLTS